MRGTTRHGYNPYVLPFLSEGYYPADFFGIRVFKHPLHHERSDGSSNCLGSEFVFCLFHVEGPFELIDSSISSLGFYMPPELQDWLGRSGSRVGTDEGQSI